MRRILLTLSAVVSLSVPAAAQQQRVCTSQGCYYTAVPAYRTAAAQPQYRHARPVQYARPPAYYQAPQRVCTPQGCSYVYPQQQQQQQQRYVAPSARPVSYAAPAAAPAPSAGDVSGSFIPWLNSLRAASGLGPVGYDAALVTWAMSNNGQQMARGLGHFVMGPARRQNAAMAQSAGQAYQMWWASAPHRAALLDPSITVVGVAVSGQWWTMNAR